ncbi:MAG: DUF308 domain-containing protein [Streptosporangiaceae bacterium]
MTEPGTSPTSPAGEPGGMTPAGGSESGVTGPGTTGSGPAIGGASGTGSGPTGASTMGTQGPGSGGTATETRATTSQATVPQQGGQRPAADTMTGSETERDRYAYGTGANIIAASAGRAWGAVLFGSLALIAVGVMLLVWPSASLNVIAVLIGAAIVVSGVVKLYEGFTARAESGGMRAAYIVIGLIAVIVGIYCIRNHALTLFLVAFVTGVYFIMHGIADIAVAVSAPIPNRGLRGVLGVFSLAAGILMVVWPSITLVILFTLVAAWLLFYGVILGVMAFNLRRISKRTVSSQQAMPALAAQ